MTIRLQSAAALICCSSLLVLPGCEDAAAKKRDQVQQSISKISQELTVALAGAGGPIDEKFEHSVQAQQRLNAVLSHLNEINGGEPGQEAAKSLLAATALRQLADMHLATAELIETEQRAERAIIRDKVAAAQELAAVVAGSRQVDGQAEREALMRQLETAKTEIGELSDKFSQLEGPISKHNSQNQVNAAEVEKLRAEVGQTLRRAQELGHADGFDTYRQAKHVEREADKLEYQIAQREIELDYSLTPEHEMVGSRVSELQGLIQSIEAAQKQLEGFKAASNKEIETTENQMKQLAGEIDKSIDSINSISNGKLKESYEQAIAALEKGAADAESATRNLKGDDVHAARMVAVRAREALGRVHWSVARGFADHKNTLDLVVQAADEIGASGDFTKQLGEASVAYDASIKSAAEAYATAIEQLGNVQSRGDSVSLDAYRTSLDRANGLLTGREAAPAPESDEPATDRPARNASSASAASSAAGAASPEELVAALKSIKGTEDVEVFFNLIDDQQAPAGMKAFLNAMRSITSGAKQLDEALQAKFGRTDEQFKSGMAAGAQSMPPMDDVKLVSVEGDTGIISNPNARRGQNDLQIKKINGRWFISPDAIGGGGTPEERQMADAMMRGMAQSFQNIGSVIKQLAQNVARGDYASFEEYQKDAEAKMQKAAGGMLGGMMQNPGANRRNN